jgi:hypothetical protein
MVLSNFDIILMKGILIIIVLVIGFFIFTRTRTFAKGASGKKMSFNKKTKPFSAEIDLYKSSRLNPANIEMVVTNTGSREIDLHAPVMIFKRWFTKRKFRVLKVEHSEIYPILLERDKTYVLDISLDQLYETVPELQLACRMSVEMKDLGGRSYKSKTIRLKWF